MSCDFLSFVVVCTDDEQVSCVRTSLALCSFQTQVGGDYYTGEYDYITLDGSQPETGTETTAQGQVRFRVSTSVRLM